MAATKAKGVPRVVLESVLPGDVPIFVHPEWSEWSSWLCQGMTARDFDLRLFGTGSGVEDLNRVRGRWQRLGRRTGFERVVHARQLHGRDVTLHPAGSDDPAGLILSGDCDGHCTAAEGMLLTIATADCVPVFLVEPDQRIIALLHAGWRGAAAGILEEGVRTLTRQFAVRMENVHLHLGPAICGGCYEVGTEVFEALGLPVPSAPAPIDLRRVLAERAVSLGADPGRMTLSGFCTRCGESPFFSHRGGSEGRQVAFLGIRDRSTEHASRE